MTEKHISEMMPQEYAKALRLACRDFAAPPRAPRKRPPALDMTAEEYNAAKRAITARVRQST